jgi:hypothetical protein
MRPFRLRFNFARVLSRGIARRQWLRRSIYVRLVASLAIVLVCSGMEAVWVAAQDYPGPQNPAPQTPSPVLVPPGPAPTKPPPGGFPSDLGGDRPRVAPDPLREGRILPDSGVEVGAGALSVSVESHLLQFKQGPQDLLSDGAILSADVVLDDWRLSYSKVLLRRHLESGAFYQGNAVDFIGVDEDQFWAFYGWRPHHSLYLGAGVGYEYRLVRLSVDGAPVATLTENLGAGAVVASWAIAPPITLQFRAFQEEGGRIITVSGTTFELGYIVPF